MFRKKPPQPSSPSESGSTESGSSDEDFATEEKQAFVRNDRNLEDDHKKGEDKEEEDDDEEEEDDDDDDDDDDEEVVEPLIVNPPPPPPVSKEDDSGSSSESESQEKRIASKEDTHEKGVESKEDGSESDSESQSDGSSDSPDLSEKFVVQNKLILDDSAKNQVKLMKPMKQEYGEDQSTKKMKTKRAGEDVSDSRLSPKKRRKDFEVNVSKGEQPSVTGKAKRPDKDASLEKAEKKAIKDKPPPLQNGAKKEDAEKHVKFQVKDKGDDKETQSSKKAEDTVEISKKPKERKNEEKPLKNVGSDIPLSPQKVKHWSPQEEIVLSTEIMNYSKAGNAVPNKKTDGYWGKLCEKLNGKLANEWSSEQLCDKVKRMRTRYYGMAEKVKGSIGPYNFRNKTDQALFGIWSQLWGNGIDSNSEDCGGSEDSKKKVNMEAAATPSNGAKIVGSKKVVDTPKPKQVEKQNIKTGKPEIKEGERASIVPMELDNPPPVTQHDRGVSQELVNDDSKFLQMEVQALLLGLEEGTQKILKEWQSGTVSALENILRVVGDQSFSTRGVAPLGMGGLMNLSPMRSLEAVSKSPEEKALQQQWNELRLEELDLYSKRLQLLQKECKLKQQQLKLQLEGDEGSQ